MTTRRGFLAGILAAGFAPAAIGSGVLMPVRKIEILPFAFDERGAAIMRMLEQAQRLVEQTCGIPPHMLHEVREAYRDSLRYGTSVTAGGWRVDPLKWAAP